MDEVRLTALDDAARAAEALWRKAYDEDVPRSYVQKHATIKEAMLALMEGAGAQAPLVIHEDEVVTRGQADEEACRLANALARRGIAKGDRVSIVVSNRPEVVVAFMACYKAGFVAAAYNQRCTSREIAGSLAQAGSTALIIEREMLHKVVSPVSGGSCPTLRDIVVLDGLDDPACDAGPCRLHSYEEFLASEDAREPVTRVKPDDDAILLFTGGTTGKSKACCQTQGAMAFELEAMARWCAPALRTPAPSILVCMPMTHIMGINYGANWQLVNGGSVVLSKGGRPDQVIECLRRHRPNVWAALPTLMHAALRDGRLAGSPYQDLDLVIFGGSFIAGETLAELASLTRGAFVESYGMSESFGFVTCNPVASGGKRGSIGVPLSNTDVLVVDIEEGRRALPFGERGEIVFRGPQTVREYWSDPQETAVALRDGWLFSGDVGYMDEDGYLYLVDRKKDTIVVSGFNVFPNEVDEVLMAHPDVADACTIGTPDDHSGERVKSFVVMREGSALDVEGLREWCRKGLVAYKVPKYVEEVEEIPITKAKKQDRKRLREWERHRVEKGPAGKQGA